MPTRPVKAAKRIARKRVPTTRVMRRKSFVLSFMYITETLK